MFKFDELILDDKENLLKELDETFGEGTSEDFLEAFSLSKALISLYNEKKYSTGIIGTAISRTIDYLVDVRGEDFEDIINIIKICYKQSHKD